MSVLSFLPICKIKIISISNNFTNIDIDECNREHCCSANALCVNIPGSYQCQCKSDFTGDGVSCRGTVCIHKTHNITKTQSCQKHLYLVLIFGLDRKKTLEY